MPYEKEIQILSELRSEYSCFDPNEREYYHALSEAIRSLKTVDAVSVVRCKDCEFYDKDEKWCSICNHKLQTTGLPSYCPNCGAKMDEVEDGKTN